MLSRFNPKGPLVSAQQMRSIDRYVIEELGVPSLCLMENAGRAVAEVCLRRLRRLKGRVVIVCGPGNNGGDGLVAARHLLAQGRDVSVALTVPSHVLKGDAAVHAQNLVKSGVPLKGLWSQGGRFSSRVFDGAAIIVDALFGVGLKRPLEGTSARIVDKINQSKTLVVAVDVPSGLDATTGQVWGCAVKADVTVTMGCCKQGLLTGEGPAHCGTIFVEDLGVPLKVMKKLLRGSI